MHDAKWPQHLLAVATILLAWALSGRAWGFDLDDPLGIDKAAQKAVDKAMKGLDAATLNLRETTNQFGALVADLYGPDKARAERSKKIFAGVLGREVRTGETPRIGLSIGLISKPSQPVEQLDVDVQFLGSDDKLAYEAVRQKFDGKATGWVAHPISGVSLTPVDDVALRARVHAQAVQYVSTDHPLMDCPGGNQEQQCRAERRALQAKALTETVMSMMPSPAVLPAKNLWTTDIPGGLYVAILAREVELKRLKADSYLVAWVHDIASPENKTSRFRGGKPWEGAPSDWRRIAWTPRP